MIELFALWCGLVGLLIAGGGQFDKRLRPADREELVDRLETSFPPYPLDWFQNVNKAFQLVFERLYGYKNTPLERLVWIGISMTYFTFAIIRVLLWLTGLEPPETPVLLTAALGLSLTMVLMLAGVFGSAELVNILEYVDNLLPAPDYPKITYSIRLVSASLLMGVFVITPALLTTVTSITIPVTIGLALLGFVILSVPYFGLLPKSMYPIKGIQGRGYALLGASLSILGFTILVLLDVAFANEMGVTPQLLVGFAITAILGPPVLCVALLIPERLHPVNPIHAMFSSLVFVVLVGFINPDAGRAFIETIQVTGPLVLSFLAFNMFADAISLLETRWILIKSQDISPPFLLVLLVADLLLSGLIYVILPLFVGQDPTVFWQGILFTGPRPWIGILFWSTFSTSAIFYLFVISALAVQVQKPIARVLGRIGVALQFEEHPMFFISTVISLLITVLFALLAVGRSLG